MSASRFVTSAVFKLRPSRTLVVQFSQLLPPDRCSHSRRFFSYFCNSSSNRQFQQRWPSLLAFSSHPSTLLSTARCFSQKPGETTTTTTTAAKPILGTFQGLGIAEQVQQQQTESADGAGAGSSNSEDEEEAKRKKEAEASWRAMK